LCREEGFGNQNKKYATESTENTEIINKENEMELIDAHAHLGYEPLLGDVEGVVARSRAAGVTGWISVGTGKEENQRAVELAGRFEGMYAGLGYHPHYAQDVTAEDMELLAEMAKGPKVVAIGETGLDFHYNFSKQPAQIDIFRKHLEIAVSAKLPVIIHSRNAFDETMEVLKDFEGKAGRMVFHCFSEKPEQAKFLVERGYYISFTGVITFKNAEGARQAVAAVPLERMMVETDCPYMSPEPMRKQKTNEPALMVHTAKKIAEIKGVSLEEAAAKLTATTKEFFGI